MKVSAILLLIILLLSLFLFSSCGKKAECEKSSECATGNPCIIGRCREGTCVNNIKTDCCGNARCEPNAQENKCLCSMDCGKCEGKVKYNVSAYKGQKEEEAEYAQYMCINSKCIVSVAEEDVSILRITSDFMERGSFKADVLTTLNNPFDTNRDKASVRVQLKDLDLDVVGGVTFTGIQVLSSSELMGEKLIKNTLTRVGDTFTEELALASSQSTVEEEKYLDIKVDYEYVKTERDGPTIIRDSSQERISEKVLFVSD